MSKLQVITIGLAVVLLLVAAGCGSCSSAPESPGELETSDAPREAVPRFDDEQRDAQREAMWSFGFELFGRVYAGGDSATTVVAPYATAALLGRLYAGADGQTRAEFAELFSSRLDDEQIHGLFNYLEREFARQAGGDFTYYDLQAVFADDDLPVRQSYLDALASHYGDGVHRLDLGGETEESVRRINNWLAHGVDREFSDLLDVGDVESNRPVVATGAASVEGLWQYRFDRDRETRSFRRPDGSTEDVEMMRGEQMYRFAQPVGTRAVAISYQGTNATFIAMMPSDEEQDFNEWVEEFDAGEFGRVVDSLGSLQSGEILLPRFDAADRLELRDHLGAMGLQTLFEPERADLSGLHELEDDPVVVDQIVQAATVSVREHGGREATQQERDYRDERGGADSVEVLHFDRPFVYAVYDQGTEMLLALGAFAGNR